MEKEDGVCGAEGREEQQRLTVPPLGWARARREQWYLARR
jgi:hypothetical protein